MGDIYELALELCKDRISYYRKYNNIDKDTELEESDIEDLIWFCFELNFTYFTDLVEKLVPLIEVGKSPLTEKIYQGFAVDGHWLIKKEYSK